MKKSVCVDLDGTIAQYDDWKGVDVIGNPIPGAREFLQELSEKYAVIIHTTRTNVGMNDGFSEAQLVMYVKDWLDKNNMTYDKVSIGKGKPIAIAYVDDRAVVCRPQVDQDAFTYAMERIELLDH